MDRRFGLGIRFLQFYHFGNEKPKKPWIGPEKIIILEKRANTWVCPYYMFAKKNSSVGADTPTAVQARVSARNPAFHPQKNHHPH